MRQGVAGGPVCLLSRGAACLLHCQVQEARRQAASREAPPSPCLLTPAPPALRHRRFLAPGQEVDVWVELGVPRGSGQGVAQVVAQLTALDGRVVAKASRAALLRSDWWSVGCACSAAGWEGVRVGPAACSLSSGPAVLAIPPLPLQRQCSAAGHPSAVPRLHLRAAPSRWRRCAGWAWAARCAACACRCSAATVRSGTHLLWVPPWPSR